MSTNINSLRSMMRFSGLATGLDTETMVKDLMKVEKFKVDKLKQDKQVIEWRKEQYREMISSIQSFKRDFFDRANPQNFMLSPNAYRPYQVSSSAGDVVSAAANSDATAGKVVIDKVLQLAEPATVQSGSAAPGPDGIIGTSSKVSITVNGKKTEIQINAGMSIRQAMNTINASDAGVRITYDSFSQKYTMATNGTGESQTLKLEGAMFFETMGLATPTPVTGKDASFVIGGTTHTRGSNTFSVDGVTYTLLKTTDEPVTITMAPDVEKAYQNIKTFVDKYNELIDKINSKTREKINPGFRPLTEEQRSAMKDKEIEQWEEKAKSGLLNGDALLQRMALEMRRALSDTVPGSGISLSSIGIATAGYYELGKLHIDETKLKSALANNPEQVMDLFSRSAGPSYHADMTAAERSARYNNSGLAVRLADILEDNIRTTRDKNDRKGLLLEQAGISGDTTEFKNLLDSQIKRINERLDRANDVLRRKEDRYWRQFTALEKSINTMNSQSAWLASQFQSK